MMLAVGADDDIALTLRFGSIHQLQRSRPRSLRPQRIERGNLEMPLVKFSRIAGKAVNRSLRSLPTSAIPIFRYSTGNSRAPRALRRAIFVSITESCCQHRRLTQIQSRSELSRAVTSDGQVGPLHVLEPRVETPARKQGQLFDPRHIQCCGSIGLSR